MNIKDNYHIISEFFFWGGEGKKKKKKENSTILKIWLKPKSV